MIMFHFLGIDIRSDVNGVLNADIRSVQEPEEVYLHKTMLQKGDKILQAGLGTGWLAIYCAYLVGNSKNVTVYDIDPNAIAWGKYLKYNEETMNILWGALTDKKQDNNTIEVFLRKSPLVSSIETTDEKREEWETTEKISVPATQINDAIYKSGANVLSLDVEGYELQLLKELDFKLIDVLLVELHPFNYQKQEDKDVILDIIKRNGFNLHAYIERNDGRCSYVAASRFNTINRTNDWG